MKLNARSFYRPQGLTFDEIRGILPYLQAMGFDGIFLAPILSALSYRSENRQSWHGYDTIDRYVIAQELGGLPAFDRLMRAVRRRKMAVCLDVVPNHDSDQNAAYQSGSSDYDWYTVGAERHCGNFFGLGWLPRLRIHNREVHDRTQSFVLELIAKYRIEVVRRDHSDGLFFPKQAAAWTTEMLRKLGSTATIVDEKIIQPGETMPADTGTVGETGYKPLTLGNLVSHNAAGVARIQQAWQAKTGNNLSDREAAVICKREAAFQHFPADLVRVCADINKLAVARGEATITVEALADMLGSFNVYRIYPEPGKPMHDEDAAVLDQSTLPQWYKDALKAGDAEVVIGAAAIYPLMSAVFAKGVEDRMFYRQTPLMSLREVGGALGVFGISVDEYHREMIDWTRQHPETWGTTDTHDTKRSLVSRARLAACSWVADEYLDTIARLEQASAHYKPSELGAQAQDLVFQTLISVWPFPVARLMSKPNGEVGYFVKAFREKCAETSWFNNNREWEQQVEKFVLDICGDRAFLDVLEPFCQRVTEIGLNLALNQQLLKLFASPVADFYHGAEGPDNVWLVDPDNRLAQDYGKLHRLLKGIRRGKPATNETKMMKLVWTVLQARKRNPDAMDCPYEVIDLGPGKIGIKRGRLVALMAIDPAVSDVSNDGPEGENLLDFGRQVVRLVA